jgi:hypothetical protein
MAEIRGNYGLLVKGTAAKASEVFDEAAEVYKRQLPGFVKNRADDAAQYNVSGLSGAGQLVKRNEAASYTKNRRYKTYDTNFVHTTYSAQLEVAMELLQDRDVSGIWDEVRQLRIAAEFWRQKSIFQVFNGGFATTTAVNGVDLTFYGDSVALFSTAHPRVDGGSNQSNASSTGIPLTESNLETGLLALRKQLLDDGTPIRDLGRIHLVVPADLDKTARIITGSQARSATANNDMNIYNDGSLPVLSTHLLSSVNGGSNTAWYLVAENMSKVYSIDRMAPSMNSRRADHGGLLFDVDTRLSVGHGHWLGTWGSKGDNAAYSS